MHKKRDRLLNRASSSSKHSSKGQVTIFIILGLVLLIVAGVFFVFKEEITITNPQQITPTDKSPVELVVSECLQEIGEQALFELGLQGGYIDVPQDLKENAARHVKVSPEHVIPYWAVGEQTSIPSLDEMKERLDREIEKELSSCVFDPNTFPPQFEVTEKSLILSDTQIIDSGVVFNANWNLEIRNIEGVVVQEVQEHTATSPIKLKRVYETAVKIVEKEMQELKLEDLTQDLIALEHPGVPVSGFSSQCSAKKWPVDDVKEELKNLLRVNLRELQVTGTDIVGFENIDRESCVLDLDVVDTPEVYAHNANLAQDQNCYQYNHYVWDLGQNFNQEDVRVLFEFVDDQAFNFEVTPRSGKYLKSSSIAGKNPLLKVFCMQAWKFTYDVDYPVTVRVTDETTGYNFKTAFTVHLHRNIPNRAVTQAGRNYPLFPSYSDDQYCSDARVPMTVRTNSLVENTQTGVYDSRPLEGVELTYTCLKYQCDMGQTVQGFAGMGDGTAAIRTNFPQCVGAILRGQKEGYKEDWIRVVSQDNAQLELNLAPLHSFNASNVQIVLHSFDLETIGAPMPMDDDTTALISFYFDKEDEQLLGYGQHWHDSKTLIAPALETGKSLDQELEFLVGADYTYPLEITLIRGEQYIGGYKGNWSVGWEQIRDAQKITFHALQAPSNEEDLYEFTIGLEQFSSQLPAPQIE